MVIVVFFFFKQKTAYEMRISGWSSDVCSSDLGDGSWQIPGDVVKAGDAALEQVAQRDAQLVQRADGILAQRIIVARQVRLVDGDAQVARFVELGQRQVVEVAREQPLAGLGAADQPDLAELRQQLMHQRDRQSTLHVLDLVDMQRSEEHTSELQSLMRNSYAI